MIAVSVVIIVAQTAGGYISEIIGRRRTFIILGAINIVLLPAYYLLLARTDDVGMIAFYSLGVTLFIQAGLGPAMISSIEHFPTSLRASGTSLCWNIGFALGGAMPAFVSLASGSVPGLPATLAVFLGAGSLLYLAGALIVPETKGQFN